MKMKHVLGLVLVGVLLGGLIACTPPTQQQTDPPPATAQPGTPAPAQPTPAQPAAPAPEVPANPDRPIGRGVTVAIVSETPTVAIARHATVIGHWKNVLTHNGLFRMHPEGLEPLPDLVTGFTAITDSLFDFYLRDNVYFHNGEKMTAHDVVASLYYVRTTPEQRAAHVNLLSWEAIDDYTVRIDTGVPNSMVFNDLAHQANFIMPRSLIESGHDFSVSPIGSGPFVFNDWRLGDSLSFTAFENYFDSERSPRIAYVNWRIIPEGASRTIALETGEVDYISHVAFSDIPRLEDNPNVTVLMIPGNTFQYMIMNNERPQFENRYVRWAIDMAIDRESIVIAALDGFGTPIWTTVPPMFRGVTEENTRSFDPDGARRLLAEQGVNPATLAFDLIASDETQRRKAEVIQANLADIGIPVSITQMDIATFMEQTAVGEFDASLANMTAATPQGFMRNLLTIPLINVQNRSRIYHQELTDLIEEAVVTIDPDARAAVVERAVSISNYESPYIGINMNIAVRAFNSQLVTPELAPNGFMFFNMMYWTD